MDKIQIKQFKEECKKADKELKEIIDFKRLRKWLIKNVGQRCKEFGTGCYCCNAWLGYDILRGL